MSVVGARANFMKIAPIIEAIERYNEDRLEDDGVICSSEYLLSSSQSLLGWRAAGYRIFPV
jgi:hypothetical protein